jgi:hypothetical protein
MSLYAAPQVIALVPGASAVLTLTSTLGDLTTPSFTPSISGQVTFTNLTTGPVQQTWSITAAASAYATFTVTIADTASTDTAQLTITVAPANTAVPVGYTTTGAIAMVQLRSGEGNGQPSPAQIVTLLNAGLQEVERMVGGLRLVGVFPTTASQTVQALTADVQDVLSCSWSTGPPTAQGTLVYPMDPMDQASFMDFSAGFPTVGFGPPTAFWVYRDQSGTQELQMYPAAMIGQLNVYYRGRPILWTLNSSGGNGVSTNLDPIFQEAVMLWTIARTLESRGRSGEAKAVYEPQIEAIIADLKTTVTRRNAPKFGTVRDLAGRGYPVMPWSWR